jgi:hypothetical protein
MSLSLLLALLEPKHGSNQPASDPPDPDLKKDYDAWHRGSLEKQELMLQALYLALNEVLYEQAAMNPAARQANRRILNPGPSYTKTSQDNPQAGRAIGALLAQAVGEDPFAHPLAGDDKLELRRKLREELRTHLERLMVQFPST